MGKNKTRHICDLTFCRHINTENICTIGNQENCVYYRTLQALNGYKAIAKWCDDCKKISELEEKLANADYQLEGRDLTIKELEAQIEKMKCDVLNLIKDRMNDDIDQNIIERLAEKWEIKEK